jgi:hypothetical protein
MTASDRLVLPATCRRHGAAGFTNLAIRYSGSSLIIDPHVMDVCTVSLFGENIETLMWRMTNWLGFNVTPPTIGDTAPNVTHHGLH